MAKKKQKKRHPHSRPPGPGTPKSAAGKKSPKEAPAGAKDRRANKEAARIARERARKAQARRGATRRAMYASVIGLVAFAVFTFFTRADTVQDLPQAAIAAAKSAGCSTVQTPADDAPGGQHLGAGQPTTYPDPLPATSGSHDPSPLPDTPHVYREVISETRAVHNLEHSFVIIYYRQSGDGALPQEVVTELEATAEAGKHVLMAPHASLPEGQAMALTAWNKLQTCGNNVTPDQAVTIAQGFIDAYVCTSNSPESAGC